MEFNDLFQPFTNEQKLKSFLLMQDFILEKQQKNEPFFIGRLSGNEPSLCGKILSNQSIQNYTYLINNMLVVAGIQFTHKDHYKQYVKLYTQSVSKCDLLGIWGESMYSQAKEYYDFIEKMYPNLKKICAQGLEPFYYMNNNQYCFDKIFKNKKVLIITSHEKTTKQQIANMPHIFKTNKIFHETTEFYVYKPPQQNGGNHDDNPWTYHFEKMKEDLKTIKEQTFDFDIALVSCGGFGMLISDYIFSDLKTSAIYIGGSLQLFFGIMGSRWKNSPKIIEHVNNYWTYPLDEDKPRNPQLCEGNCYW